jgi:hypothetical protein
MTTGTSLSEANLSSDTSNWGWVAENPRGALGGHVKQWCFWWSEDFQSRFEQCWEADADVLADELADRFAFVWPWMITDVLPTRAPKTQARIEALLADEELVRRSNGTNPRTVLSVSTTWGAFHTVRKQRSWDPPTTRICPVCGIEFFGGEVRIWTYRQFGPSRYCEACCLGVRRGAQGRPQRDSVIAAIRELAAASESIPKQAFAFEPIPLDAPKERRDRLVRAMCAMPSVETAKLVLCASDWLGVLQAGGLVGESWRPSRGTWCRASDGHRCRSLLEKSIDDWFSAHGLEHECEPRWPQHPVLNPSGRRRADWKLVDGSYVECLGMMSDPSYLEKIKQKRALAEVAGIDLYLVTPSDLLDLGRIFADVIDVRSGS